MGVLGPHKGIIWQAVFDEDHVTHRCVPPRKNHLTMGNGIDWFTMVAISSTWDVPIFTRMPRIAHIAPVKVPITCNTPSATIRIADRKVKPVGNGYKITLFGIIAASTNGATASGD